MRGSLRTVVGNGNGDHYLLSQLAVQFRERRVEGRTREQAVELRPEICKGFEPVRFLCWHLFVSEGGLEDTFIGSLIFTPSCQEGKPPWLRRVHAGPLGVSDALLEPPFSALRMGRQIRTSHNRCIDGHPVRFCCHLSTKRP